MSRREIEKTIHNHTEIRDAMDWAWNMTVKGLQSGPVVWRLGRERRTQMQNQLLWPLLTDISGQVEWLCDGEYRKMSPEEFKDLFSASLKRQSMAPGIDGGMVMLGGHTSKMDKETFSSLIELIYAFGAERDVQWSQNSQSTLADYGVSDEKQSG